MATKRRRGKAWHYVVRRRGVLPKPLYFSFDNEAEGDAYVRRLEAQLDRGVLPETVRRAPDLASAIARYTAAVSISADDAKLLPMLLARFTEPYRLEELTFHWAQAWVTRMKRTDNLSPSTIRHHVGALARALNWLVASGELPHNPLRLLPRGYATYTPEDARIAKREGGMLKRDTERDRRLEPGEEAEIRRLLAGGKPNDRQRAFELHHQEALTLLFNMALETCMRMREMFTLTRKQVDRGKRTIFLVKTKNGRKRQVPISQALEPLLDAYTGNYSGRLFPWWDGKPSTMNATTSLLSRQFGRLFHAAGMADFNFHDLRHEAISRIYERTDLTDIEVSNITGHTDLRSLRRYANLRGSHLAGRL